MKKMDVVEKKMFAYKLSRICEDIIFATILLSFGFAGVVYMMIENYYVLIESVTAVYKTCSIASFIVATLFIIARTVLRKYAFKDNLLKETVTFHK